MSAENDTGQPPPKVSEERSKSEQDSKPSRVCGWKCVAFLPVVVIIILYNIPHFMDEYEAAVGYANN